MRLLIRSPNTQPQPRRQAAPRSTSARPASCATRQDRRAAAVGPMRRTVGQRPSGTCRLPSPASTPPRLARVTRAWPLGLGRSSGRRERPGRLRVWPSRPRQRRIIRTKSSSAKQSSANLRPSVSRPALGLLGGDGKHLGLPATRLTFVFQLGTAWSPRCERRLAVLPESSIANRRKILRGGRSVTAGG